MRNQPNNTSNDSKSKQIIDSDEFMYNEGNSFSQSELDKKKAEEFQRMFSAFQKMASDPSLFMKMMSSVK